MVRLIHFNTFSVSIDNSKIDMTCNRGIIFTATISFLFGIAERRGSMFNARTTDECKWGEWGQCSESCGNGFMERVRMNTAGQSGKENCNDLPKEKKRCQLRNNNCEGTHTT